MRAQFKGRADRLDDSIRDHSHVCLAGNAFKDGGKFVAAHASDRVHFTDAFREPRGDDPQQLIADIVP